MTKRLIETVFTYYIDEKYNLLRRHNNHEPIRKFKKKDKCTNP